MTGQIRPDILLDIAFPIAHPERTVIRTNAKEEALEEILTDFLLDQIGRGKDETPPLEHAVYRIKLGLRISDAEGDAWGLEHNCGNESLMAGILMDVVGRLSNVEVRHLEEGG